MKRILLTSAALAALTASGHAADIVRPKPVVPVPVALPTHTGDITLYGGWFRWSSSQNDEHQGPALGGNARIAFQNAGINWQLDFGAETLDAQGYARETIFDGAIHFGHVTAPGVLSGGFVSIGHHDFPDLNATDWTVGAEWLRTAGPTQLYLQGGYSGAGSANAWYVQGEARLFHTPNMLFAANLGFVSANDTDNTHHNFVRWGLDWEFKHDNSPLSVFVNYHGDYDTETNGNAVAHVVLGGVRFSFGTTTLQDAATRGPALKDYNPFSGVNHLALFDHL